VEFAAGKTESNDPKTAASVRLFVHFVPSPRPASGPSFFRRAQVCEHMTCCFVDGKCFRVAKISQKRRVLSNLPSFSKGNECAMKVKRGTMATDSERGRVLRSAVPHHVEWRDAREAERIDLCFQAAHVQTASRGP